MKRLSLGLALLPILLLVGLLGTNVIFFGEDSSYGSNQIALLIAALVAGGIGMTRGVKWDTISKAIASNISQATDAIIILLLIGALTGTWLLAGIIPAFIHYGLQILEPSIFLFAACIVCAMLSLATGSSWGTIGTVGIALIGIGSALGIHEGWVAGAIISGAYFGDKLSPLSDTTNLAPAVAGTDLITHIKYMTITTVPSMVIALLVFLVIGFTSVSESKDLVYNEVFSEVISSKFNIHLGLFIAPVIVLIMIAKKVPASAALFIGVLLGGLSAIIFQPQAIKELAGKELSFAEASYYSSITAMAVETQFISCNEECETALVSEIQKFSDYVSEETSFEEHYSDLDGNEQKILRQKALNKAKSQEYPEYQEFLLLSVKKDVDGLLKAKGMQGMMNTIWLIICAMVFGAVLQAVGILKRITEGLISGVNSVVGLIKSTVGTCLAFNLLASDQYIAIVVPGKMFSEAYEEQNLAPENLSRTLEDAGTVTSVLIPWNTCGVAQSGILGVATLAYAPYCIFNWVSPIMSIVIASLGYKIKRLDK